MSFEIRMKKILLTLSIFLLSTPGFAWSNYFRFLNNFDEPLTISINPTKSNVINLCGGGITNIEVQEGSQSCEFQFDTELSKITPINQGQIIISKKNDPGSFCTYNYDYTYKIIPYSYFDIRSENISFVSCHGNLSPKEISVGNPHTQALPRPMVKVLGNELTQSISIADCGGQGGDNCIIASPDLTTTYKNQGSNLTQSLILQSKLDEYEPLNFEQFIGSHNSAISPHYTSSTSDTNLSHSDPDNFLTLTDQLNSGVRQLELDIMAIDNKIMLCHTDTQVDPLGLLCSGNYPLTIALTEIKSWIEKNPKALLFIYLDVHAPLGKNVSILDSDLSTLDSYVFTPEMANQYFHVTNNTLPAFQLTQDQLINQYNKNIIFTNDDDRVNLSNSKYVFVNIQNTSSSPLTEMGVDVFLQSNYSSCSEQTKYADIKQLFSGDPDHFNLLRLNAARTTMNYITSVKSKSPDQYVDYFTTQNLSNMLNCPVNIFSTSMIGFTCDSSLCSSHPSDPKLRNFLWSWGLGFPLQQGGSQLAYINPKTNHFENNALQSGNSYAVLCYHKTTQTSPTAPLSWFLNSIKLTNVENAYDLAQASCQSSGGLFAVPTVSYWMHDALTLIKSQDQNVLVNYSNQNGEWIPNAQYVIQNNKPVLRGNSLVK